ncbi:MAG: FliM/FliN family flagellar motor switch protein [Archangium sp.]|nr:FliM/FliN family flagellar motor switch protein [Archangium sp.]
MRDATTIVGPSPEELITPKPRARRVNLTPLKRFTRAHLELASRSGVREEALAAMTAATQALSAQLGQNVMATARLLDGTLQPMQHLGGESVFVVAELSAASAMAIVELEGPVASYLLRHAAGSDARTVAVMALTRIESAALGWLALSVIKALRSVTGFEQRFSPRLVNVTMDRGDALRGIDAAVRHLVVELQLSGEHPIGTARVMVPAKMLQLAVQTAPVSETPPAHDVVLDTNLEAQTHFGRAELLRADSGDLAPGDVIVFAGTYLSDGRLFGPARFRTRSFELSGELGADGLVVSRAVPLTKEQPMPTSINVDVEIELTTIQLPVRQLGAITPGAVLPLHINAAQTVTLRIDGKAVALAELVEVEGEIGARITAMLEPAP